MRRIARSRKMEADMERYQELLSNLQSPIVAWLTLDEEDNAPARFPTTLVAALQWLNPACGATAQTLLASLSNPGAKARWVIGVLIGDF